MSMNTKRLTVDNVAQGAAVIAQGGLLGIPTETVGLRPSKPVGS